MDATDFAQTRRYLDKTQLQIAGLLGVSLKAVQSFEQGWRRVPAHIERQLLFLLYLSRLPLDGTTPCWEARDCGPEVRAKCMAWEVQAGHLCWFVNGTLCEGRAQASWDRKMQFCRRCEVFRSSVGFPTRFGLTEPDEERIGECS